MRETLRSMRWDLVIVDRARKMAAYAYETKRERKVDKTQRYRLDRNLTVDAPHVFGAAVVVSLCSAPPEQSTFVYPEPSSSPSLGRETTSPYDADLRDESEAVGMAVVMAYKRDHNWHPEDVSGENLGSAVRPIGHNPDGALVGARYIEVKARAQSGTVRISANELRKVRHFGDDFWLHIVTMASTTSPELQQIQNPRCSSGWTRISRRRGTSFKSKYGNNA